MEQTSQQASQSNLAQSKATSTPQEDKPKRTLGSWLGAMAFLLLAWGGGGLLLLVAIAEGANGRGPLAGVILIRLL
jgi:hypothetical protein